MLSKTQKFPLKHIAGLALLLLTCIDCARVSAQPWIPVEVTVNGTPLRLVFDTCATHSALYKPAVDRLKLETTSNPDEVAPPGFLATPLTEPVKLTIGDSSATMSFAVLAIPPQINTREFDGFISWNVFRDNILVINSSLKCRVLDELPEFVRNWRSYDLRKDTMLLGFKVPGSKENHNTIYVDTGAYEGLSLHPKLWEEWIDAVPKPPLTLEASYSPAVGTVVSEVRWAKQVLVSDLEFREVPVKKEMPALTEKLMIDHGARMGLYAIRRRNVAIDAANDKIYIADSKESVPEFSHNRLGAVFVPREFAPGPLFAHVGAGTPAEKAGVLSGDILLAIDGQDKTNWFEKRVPTNTIFRRPGKSKVELKLMREGAEITVNATLRTILKPVED